MPLERLQKIIAAAGIASRRKVEELMTQGRVTVNGQIITELGTKADIERDHIKVDGKLLHGPERHIYLVLNKPKGYVTTVSDPEGRDTVMSLVRNVGQRVYPVGRLDYLSEGLLLLTNDGELANKLTRAASHVPKTYLVKISGRADEAAIEKLRRGIKLAGRQYRAPGKPGYPQPERKAAVNDAKPVRTAPAEIRLLREADNPWYEVTLIEGKNRQIRRMFEEIGHHVEKIRRVRYGPLSLDVEPGQFRELTSPEVESLRRLDKPARVEQRARGATRHQKSSLPKPRRATAPRERGRSGNVRGEGAHQRFERGEPAKRNAGHGFKANENRRNHKPNQAENRERRFERPRKPGNRGRFRRPQ